MLKMLATLLKHFFPPSKSIQNSTREKVDLDWLNINAMLKGASPSQLKQALITADRSLDTVLRDLTVGETMGERLKNAKELFYAETYEKLWQAHKLRNALVHESGADFQHFILKKAVEDLRIGMKELGVKI